MKSLKTLLILTFFLTTLSIKAQYVFIVHTTPTTVCYGNNVYAYADISQLPPGNWRLEWYKMDNGCVPSIPWSLFSTFPQITIWETGLYICTAYDDAQGLSFNSANGVSILVLPNPAIPIGPTHLRKPQPFISNCGTTYVQLCIPDLTNTPPPIQWYKDNVAIPNATSNSYVATTSGNYSYQLIGDCASPFSESTFVTIGTSLPNQITAGGPTTFCSGGSVVLSAPAGPGLNYQWSRYGQNIAGANSNTYTVTGSGSGGMGSGGYSCTISSSLCSQVTSNIITVNIYPAQSVNFSLASDFTLASPPVTLTGNPSGGTFSGPGVSGNIFTPSIAGSGTHTITYSYTNSNGCTGSLSRTTTVCGIPPAPASITGNTVNCANGQSFWYSCSAVTGATSYNWTVPTGTTIMSGQGTTNVFINFGVSFTSGIISVTATKTGCGTSAPQTKSVTSKPAQPGTITGQNTGVCAGTVSVPFSVAAVIGATSYNWTASSGATIVSGQGTTQVLVNFGSTFSSGTISVTASNSCGSSPVRSKAISSKPPTPGAISGPTSFCTNQQGVAYSIAAVPGASTYNWQVPNGASVASGQGTTSITVNFGNKAGKIKVAAGNSCGLSNYKQLNVSKNCRIGMFEDPVSSAALIYPNPSSTDFILKTGISDDSAMELQIFDVSGKLIIEETIHGSEYLINGSSFTPGVYQVLLKNYEQLQRIRIVKNE